MSNTQSHYAYGADRADIEAIMRFGAVKRWHMIDTTRQQTLAEHSACVAGLVYIIASKCSGYFGDAYKIAFEALVHDMAEVFTGDFPSHSKSRLSGVKELEEELLPYWLKANPTQSPKVLIKLCDLADGIRFIRLHGVDVTSRHAQEGLQEQYNKKVEFIKEIWPEHVVEIAVSHTTFYAYEYS